MSTYYIVPFEEEVENGIRSKEQADSDYKHSSEVDCEVGTASSHDEESARHSKESISFQTGEPEQQPSFLQRQVTISVALILIIATFSLILIIPLLERLVQRQGSRTPAIANELNITSTPGCTDPGLEDIDGVFDPRALQELCAGVKWQNGLVFSVRQSIAGGVSNIRNAFEDSLRFAIEAGATAYVMPRIVHRNAINIDAWDLADLRDYSYLFDRAHFKARLGLVCPQIKIYDDINDIVEEAGVNKPFEFTPAGLDAEIHHDHTIGHPNTWRISFDELLAKNNIQFSSSKPVLVQMNDIFLEWPVQYDNPAIVATFGRMYRAPCQVRRLSVAVLKELQSRYALTISMSNMSSSSSEGYFAAHLRTEQDTNGHFNTFEVQANKYFKLASARGFKIMYVASGDIGEVAKLREQASRDYAITVVTKADLLGGEDREAMRELSWDQQGMIDYEILLRAGYFAGVGASSFSYNAAIKRHSTLMSKDPNATWAPEDMVEPWWSHNDKEDVDSHSDGLSTLLTHEYGALFQETLWPKGR